MGCACCHNSNVKKRRSSFIEYTETASQNRKIVSHLDLPYRHYITKTNYIASAIPQTLHKLPNKNHFRILQSIESSSIMKRRCSKDINDLVQGQKTADTVFY